MTPDLPSLNYRAALYAVLFAAVFAAASWMVPAAYYQLSPASDHIEITEVDVERQPAIEMQHRMNISYKAQNRSPVEATITLYRHGESGSRIGIATWGFEGFVEQGTSSVSLPLKRETKLQTGLYSYDISVTVHLDYHAVKTLTVTTESFRVVNPNETANQTTPTPTPTGTPTPTPRPPNATPTPTPLPTVTPANNSSISTPTPTPTHAWSKSTDA